MRTLSAWEQQLATTDDGGVQLHQYATADLRLEVPGGEVQLAMTTDYPWDGRVSVEVRSAPDGPWTLTLRRPGWAQAASVAWPDGEAMAAPGDGSPLSRTATWRPGDRVEVHLD